MFNNDLKIQDLSDKLNTIVGQLEGRESDLTARERASMSVAVENIQREASPYTRGSQLANELVTKCMQVRGVLVNSIPATEKSQREKRAVVISRGVNNVGYNIPWERH